MSNNFSLIHSPNDISVGELVAASTIRPTTIWTNILGNTVIDTIIPPVPGAHMLILTFDDPLPDVEQISANGNVIRTMQGDVNIPILLFYEPTTKKYYGGNLDATE